MKTQPIRKTKAGVIGFGKMGMIHSAALRMNPKSELCAVLDIDERLIDNLKGAGFGNCFYTQLDEMLEQVDLDAVFICTPNQTHHPIAAECLLRGLDIFVEMPLAESYSTAKRMREMVSQKRVLHAVGYTLPFEPVYQKAKELVDLQILGEIRRFRASFYCSLPYEAPEDWMLDKQLSGGGVVLNSASSLLFLIYWFFGPAKSLTARTCHRTDKIEDAASIIMTFSSGMIGLVDISWNRPGYPQPFTRCIIEGSQGIMEVSDDSIKLYLHRKSKGLERGWTIFDKSDLPSSSAFFLGEEGYYEGNRTFMDCVQKRKPHPVSWNEGCEVMHVIQAIYCSAQSREEVSLEETDS